MEHIEPILKDILAELKSLREQSAHAPRPFLAIEEVAELLGVSSKTVRNQLSAKKFPIRPLRIGRRVLFRAADLAKL